MLDFLPESPFPLLPDGSHTYAEAQAHAEKVDAWLGLRTAQTEASLSAETSGDSPRMIQFAQEQNLWIDLPVRTLLTPYTEIRKILQHLQPLPGQRVVDLGAGYGRMGFVMGHHYPEVEFIGYEFVAKRVKEGARCLELQKIKNARLLEADLNSPEFRPLAAEFYFIYDFGSRDAIRKCLNDLRFISKTHPITVVGRGRSSRDAIERGEPWLSAVVPAEHHEHYSIYRSAH